MARGSGVLGIWGVRGLFLNLEHQLEMGAHYSEFLVQSVTLSDIFNICQYSSHVNEHLATF